MGNDGVQVMSVAQGTTAIQRYGIIPGENLYNRAPDDNEAKKVTAKIFEIFDPKKTGIINGAQIHAVDALDRNVEQYISHESSSIFCPTLSAHDFKSAADNKSIDPLDVKKGMSTFEFTKLLGGDIYPENGKLDRKLLEEKLPCGMASPNPIIQITPDQAMLKLSEDPKALEKMKSFLGDFQ